MVHTKNTHVSSDVNNAIYQFLNAPPKGTPAEIIELFGEMEGQEFLPPKLFLETVQQAPIAISITDPGANILYVNAAFESLTGYLAKEIIGKNQSTLSSKSTPLKVYKKLWKTIKDKKVWNGKLVNHRKDKQEYLAEVTISPVLNAQKEVAYFLGMHRDNTQLHQLEQQLAFQKGLTEAALDAAPMVVAMLSSEGKVLMDNLAYKALLGDLRGTEPAKLFMEALELQLGAEFKNICTADKQFTNVDVRLDTVGNAQPRWFSCSGVKVPEPDITAHNFFKGPDKSRCYLLLIANEVTGSRKRVNDARLNMIRASMAENQMAQTMREAISGAIYKLQVPLNVIRAALSLPGEQKDSNNLKNILAHALESGEEAMDSLHSALPDTMEESSSRVNVNELLHEVLKLSTDKLLANGIVIDWRPMAVLPTLDGRANALRGLFMYLLDNAIKAVSESDQDYREIRLQTDHDDNDVIITIIDNGPGISDVQRLKVFEPFYCGWMTPGVHAGMGLTLAQEVVLNHYGSLEIDNNFFGGCRIYARLPINGKEVSI